MILAQISSFGTKKITDTACTTSGSGHHGLYSLMIVLLISRVAVVRSGVSDGELR